MLESRSRISFQLSHLVCWNSFDRCLVKGDPHHFVSVVHGYFFLATTHTFHPSGPGGRPLRSHGVSIRFSGDVFGWLLAMAIRPCMLALGHACTRYVYGSHHEEAGCPMDPCLSMDPSCSPSCMGLVHLPGDGSIPAWCLGLGSNQ